MTTDPTPCKWDRETSLYVQPDGETCDVPKAGHCTARKSCSQHLAWGELTCARCLSRVRSTVRRIAEVAPLMPTAALESRRIDSEAVMLAGPACNVEAWSWRKVAAMQGISWHQSQVEDDDDWHPYTVLTRWAQMLSEPESLGGYGIQRPDEWTITNAAAFLDRILHRVANDEDQDFRLLRSEVERCRNHLEGPQGLHIRHLPEKGASCPDCKPAVVQLVREYAHWCDDEDCTKIHKPTDEDDIWVCPRNREHWWSHKDYSDRIEDRKASA